MKYFLIIIAFLTIVSCNNSLEKCKICDGTGKLSESSTEPLKYEIVNSFWEDESSFLESTYEYVYKVSIKNLDNIPGEFTLKVKWVYPHVGEFETESTEYINPNETKMVISRYNTQSKVPKALYLITPSNTIRTKEKICFKCFGKGLTK